MAKPTLNDQYWFDLSKTMVDSGHDRRDQYAEKLQKLVLWMWGIYTAATGVGFALADKRLSILTTCIVAAASGLLIVVYWCTFWCMAPGIAGGFDPRSPDDIRDTYSTAMRVKDTRIRWTLAI